jgi:hypothetical protein
MWPWVVEHWEFVVGTAIALVGIVIAIATIVYQRQPKQLDWELRNDVRLVSPHARRLREKLELRYNDKPMDDPRVLILSVRNTGKKAVSEHDFIGGDPISITYEQNPPVDMQLIEASDGLSIDELAESVLVVQGTRSTLDVSLRIIPRLLNPGEWFDVQLLSDRDHGDVSVTARFADQKRPMRRLDMGAPGRRRLILLAVIAGLVAGAVTSLLIYLIFRSSFVRAAQNDLLVTLAAVGLVIVLFGLYKFTKWRFRRPSES